jgi:hypothetical protein
MRLHLATLLLCLALAGCSTWKGNKPPEDEEEPPTAAMRLEQAKELLKGIDTPGELSDLRITRVKRELRAVPPGEPEAPEAQALLKVVEDHERARFNQVLWNAVRRLSERRAALAAQLAESLKKIRGSDSQLQVKTEGFANTELVILSGSLSADQARAIKGVLDKTEVLKGKGFTRLVIRNQERVLIREVLAGEG